MSPWLVSPDPTPERLQHLHGLGLSEYQGQAYLALLGLGNTDARAVAGQAKVPLGKVYAVLDQLEQKGFVRKTAERPRRFAAVPIADVVEQAHQQQLRRAEELLLSKEELCHLFPTAAVPLLADDRGSVLLLRGRKNVTERLRSVVTGRQDLLGIAPLGVFQRRAMAAMLTQAAAGGTRVRLLAPPVHPEARSLLHGVQLRSREQTTATGILVADDVAALLVHFIPDDESATKAKDVGVLIEERALVQTLRQLLEQCWGEPEADVRVAEARTAMQVMQ